MFSRTLFRSTLRAFPARSTLKHPPPLLCRPITHNALSKAPLQTHARPTARTSLTPRVHERCTPSLQFSRLESQFPRPGRRGRIIHTKFDPEEVAKAKPFITTEQIRHFGFHPNTGLLAVVIGVGGVIFYVYNLEEVPVSGRRRFNCYSDANVEAQGDMMYEKLMREQRAAILPAYDPRVQMVRRVMDRLVPVSGLADSKWELHVLQSDEVNAFVLPGGKVFVYSGLLPIAQDDDGLAAVLGHEIAHNVARHSAEQLSSLVLLAPIRWSLIYLDYSGVTGGLGRILGEFAMQFGLTMPASRKQESEADYIGLMIMSKACYNPKAAVSLWERMEAANASNGPGWLSTHPTNSTRIAQMEEWMPKAEAASSESGCAVTAGYAKGFQDAFGGLSGFGNMLR